MLVVDRIFQNDLAMYPKLAEADIFNLGVKVFLIIAEETYNKLHIWIFNFEILDSLLYLVFLAKVKLNEVGLSYLNT